MCSKQSAFLFKRLVSPIQTTYRLVTGYVHPVTGKTPPTLDYGKFVMGNYGLSIPEMSGLNYQQMRTHMHHILTKKTVQDRIMLVLNLFDKVDNDKLTLDSDFFKDLGLDSLDFVEVILTIEDEFCFEIPDGDSDRLRTPRQIYQYICDKCDVYD